ncbi:pyridoxal phosphate-dependent decarboxylase family protein [Pendulispora albinea]|uniref:Pyridoxal-dependent decarboxylase n=1 Tax=Pendulispora albinea TaxID=2741071 RepID=A0ABZ2LTR9_9BACT
MTDTRELDEILNSAHEAARAFLQTAAARPVAAPLQPVPFPELPERGWGALRAIEFFRANLEPMLSGSPGPRYLGFVTGGATPAAVAGDWLVSAYDQNVSNDGDSIATAVERHTLALLRTLFGLPDAFEGAFVSGATQANLVALATARQWVYDRVGVDVAQVGLAGAPPVAVLGGSPHASIDKALSILGMGRASIERIPCLPGRAAIDPAALDQRLAAHAAKGGPPCIVTASAGEVNTGDFDDLRAIGAIARRYGAWFHVDGAFGLFAAVDPELAHLVAGVEAADSIAADAHKWLNVPYDSAFVWTRHLPLQERVFRAAGPYLGAGPDLLHRTPENSRRFRALPAWMTLMAYGREGYRAIIHRCCAHARRLGAHLAASSSFELLDEVRLNILCFAPRGGDPSQRDRVLEALRAGGRAFLTPTTFSGRPAIRAAFSNWSTTDDDVALIARALDDAAASALTP